MSNELILTGTTELANADLYTSKVISNDFGQGDLSYSWLKIAQSTTEQVKKMSTSRIDGLEEGMFFDSLTSRVFGNSIKLVFLQFFHSFREQTAGQRGEFVRVIPKDEMEHLKATKECEWVDKVGWSLQNGNVVKESWNYMVLLPEHLDLGRMRLAFGPGAKKYLNAWNTQIKMARLPSGQPAAPFSIVWELALGLDKAPPVTPSTRSDRAGRPW